MSDSRRESASAAPTHEHAATGAGVSGGVRNVSYGLPPTAEDLAHREDVLAELIGYLGSQSININDGRAWFAIPWAQYLAHVETSALERALSAVHSRAWIVARAIARLDSSELDCFDLRRSEDDLRDLIERPTDWRGRLDMAEGSLSGLPTDGAKDLPAVDISAPEVAGQPDNHFFKRRDIGDGLGPVVQVDHEDSPSPVMRRAAPPP